MRGFQDLIDNGGYGGGMFRGLLNKKPQGLVERKPVMMAAPLAMPAPPMGDPAQPRPWEETQKNLEEGRDNINRLLGRGGPEPVMSPGHLGGGAGVPTPLGGIDGAPSMSGIAGEAPAIMQGMGSVPGADAGNAAQGGMKGLFGA